jgi:hypothetical protein
MRNHRVGLDVSVTDQFCGAGGSSQGAQVAGATVKLAMNPWRLQPDPAAQRPRDARTCRL